MKRSFVGIGLVGVFVPLMATAAPILLDNFNEAKTENMLGGATGAWYDPDDTSIFCKTEFDDKVYFGTSGRSLRLDYNIKSQRENVNIPTQNSQAFPVTKGNQAFNGYYSIFQPQNLTNKTHLILWAKGDGVRGFSRSFKIEIKDGLSPMYAGYKITNLTDQWRRYAIPLRSFTDIKDWSQIKEFVIVFAADTVNRNDGVMFVDEIYFAESPEQNLSVPMESYTAGRVEEPPVLDGKLKEWVRSDWHSISGDEYVEKGGRSGGKDAGARWAVRWDDQWFYLAVDLKDNEVVNGEIGETLWKGDCLEVFVNPEGTVFNWGDSAAFQLGFSPTSSAGNPATWAWFQRRAPTDQEIKAVWSPKNDALEVAMAWSFLKMTPGLNRDLGFALAFHDQDIKDGTPECKLTCSVGNLGKIRTRIGKLVLQ
jgi:hypothetical protein